MPQTYQHYAMLSVFSLYLAVPVAIIWRALKPQPDSDGPSVAQSTEGVLLGSGE